MSRSRLGGGGISEEDRGMGGKGGLILALLLVATPAAADDAVVAPERARDAVATGLIKPLAVLLGQIEQHYQGVVIEAELHESGGHWEYEFEILPTDGRLFVLLVDASSGTVTHTTGPVQTKP